MMASETHYVLKSHNGRLELDLEKLESVLEPFRAQNIPICVIGYTYMLYQYVVAPLAAGAATAPESVTVEVVCA